MNAEKQRLRAATVCPVPAVALGHAGADKSQKVVEKIQHYGTRAYADQADVSQKNQVQAMCRRMILEFGTLDILVNNAGVQKDAPLD